MRTNFKQEELIKELMEERIFYADSEYHIGFASVCFGKS